ncbi:hypothetical protein BKA65DRAFT_139565 [Rhexocercosporidium sp. MPI-PUGE-AT-0058]|nr:hypothetical protein BKA65DRAFT_139565 [Rhexocercosporidium sp. MPI-PUGE-AT-0058]
MSPIRCSTFARHFIPRFTYTSSAPFHPPPFLHLLATVIGLEIPTVSIRMSSLLLRTCYNPYAKIFLVVCYTFFTLICRLPLFLSKFRWLGMAN